MLKFHFFFTSFGPPAGAFHWWEQEMTLPQSLSVCLLEPFTQGA